MATKFGCGRCLDGLLLVVAAAVSSLVSPANLDKREPCTNQNESRHLLRDRLGGTNNTGIRTYTLPFVKAPVLCVVFSIPPGVVLDPGEYKRRHQPRNTKKMASSAERRGSVDKETILGGPERGR